MKISFLLTGLLVLGFAPLAAQASCPSGNPQSFAYIRRDGNRCEGLKPRRESSSSSFELISFATGKVKRPYPNSLEIRIPSQENLTPKVEMQSAFRNYRLDELDVQPKGSWFSFPLNTYILRENNIPPGSLRAIAYIIQNANAFYLPVIFGRPTGEYEFVVFNPRGTGFPTYEIRQNGVRIDSKPRRLGSDQLPYKWKYGKAPRGVYELHMVDSEGESRSFYFYHNPKWL